MKKSGGLPGLGWLPIGWYLVFLLGPLALVLTTSFATRGTYGGIDWLFTGENFTRTFDPIYLSILSRSLVLAATTTLACVAIGFPIAYAMATSSARARSVYVFLLAIPFLTNLVIRVCAIKSFMAYEGPFAWFLTLAGVEFDPYALSQNTALVTFGMISTYLPFMVFPLFAALEKFDFALVEAAQDLGARYTEIVAHIVLPILKGPIIAGGLLVFIPAMGEFLIPDLLGGAKTMLAGNLISEQFLKARDWPFGSALSIFLMLVLAAFIVAARRFERDKSGDRA